MKYKAQVIELRDPKVDIVSVYIYFNARLTDNFYSRLISILSDSLIIMRDFNSYHISWVSKWWNQNKTVLAKFFEDNNHHHS